MTNPSGLAASISLEVPGSSLAGSARWRALLVEDYADLAEATSELMRRHGLEVRLATTGGEALEMAMAFNPDLVLCDMMLPDMAGLDVAHALRARGRVNRPLLAILTAMGADHLHELERGTSPRDVDVFLSKPLASKTLVNLLSKLNVSHSR